MFRLGLAPASADDLSIGNRMINARSESVAEKPAFRSAFKKRRCLILADGFYEWQKTGKIVCDRAGPARIYINGKLNAQQAIAGDASNWDGVITARRVRNQAGIGFGPARLKIQLLRKAAAAR